MGRAAKQAFRWKFLFGLALLIAACASGPDAPRWVKDKPPKDFPAARYTWGVGSAARADAAARSATEDLARKTGGEAEGAQIARTWFDEKKKVHWALAVLDRPAQLEKLGAELAATDARLAEMRTSAPQVASPTQSFALMLRAIELATTRDGLATRIGRLGGTPPPGDPADARARLEDDLIALKHSLTIDVEAWEMDPKTGQLGEPLEAIRAAIAQDVLRRGFRIGSHDDWSTSTSWLLIRARLGVEILDLGASDRFTAVEWNSSVEIHDRTGDGEVLAILTHKARSTQLNEHEARRLARSQAEGFIAKAVADWFDERTEPHGAAKPSAP